jgi:hypothetical protein
VSATTPVGISKTKTVASIAVPTSTSCSGLSPTLETKYTAVTVKLTAPAADQISSRTR